jgi:hypothetical protein
MKKVFPFYAITILLISLLAMIGIKAIDVHAQDGISPTPTYDPLKEPFVPDNPTDFELGRNQSPGWLEDKQYRAIALYIFNQNDRPLAESTLAPIMTPAYTSTTLPVTVSPVEDPSQQPAIIIYVLLWVFLVVMVIWGIRNRR